MNIYQKSAVVTAISVFTIPAFALDAGVTAALTTAGVDIGLAGAAVLLVLVGIKAFRLLQKVL